jgi:hypothetical protein
MNNKIYKKNIHIDIYCILEEELFSKKQLDVLENIISRELPIWKQDLKVLPAENAPRIASTENTSLFEAVSDVCPLRKYGLGNGQLIGSYKGIYFYLYSSRQLFTTNNNIISIEILGMLDVEGQNTSQWVMNLFVDIISSLPIRYARACHNDEFKNKNFITSGSAEGVNLYKSLPGIYWLNYFSIPYLKMIGEEKIINSSAYSIKKYNQGILLTLDENPFDWNTKSYKEREQQVIEHIGKQYFFLKDDLGRLTIAPDFATEYRDRVR